MKISLSVNIDKDIEKWRSVIGQDHAITAPFTKIKFAYLNSEWQQVHATDIFTDFKKAEMSCDFLESVDSLGELACWMDSVNYTLKKQTPRTEDLYQFVAYYGKLIGKSFVETF